MRRPSAWPEARAIHTMRPMSTSAPSAIHSHSSDEPDSLAAGEAAAAVVGAGAWLAGASAVGVGGLTLALPLGLRLEAALLTAEAALLTAPLAGPLPPHPAARDPMISAIAATARLFLSCVIPVLPSSAHAARRHPVRTAARPRHGPARQPAAGAAGTSSPVVGGPGQRGLRASIRNRWACDTNGPSSRMRQCIRAS